MATTRTARNDASTTQPGVVRDAESRLQDLLGAQAFSLDPPDRETSPGNSRFLRLYEESRAMEIEDARRAGTVGFMARAMVMATLPYKEPKNDPIAWGRRAGDISLMIQPGTYMEEVATGAGRNKRVEVVSRSMGYPYGSIPRLVVAWLSTEAVRTKSREIVLGDSLSQYMDAIGLDAKTGGRNGSITRLKDQQRRLFAARIALSSDPLAIDWSNKSFSLTDSSNIWWDPLNPGQTGLFQSTVVLGERFYEELMSCPVPVDLRALKVLRTSPMALDLYVYLTYRNFALTRPVTVPWEALRLQFGSEAGTMTKFRESFRRALRQVQAVYRVQIDPDKKSGVVLFPSGPHVKSLPKA